MKRVKEFLQKNWDQKSPLLLGYSGGPDSKSLLYSLLEAGCDSLHVAHVDHGWREESALEEVLIRQEIESLNIPYFSTKLNAVAKEVVARDKRMAFFQKLYEKTPYQALLLAHQADDLAETILKRIFEGAHLPFLGSMRLVSKYQDMTIWRPLLKTPKIELFDYLDLRQLKPLNDPTNQDTSYLRSRMRLETIPFLDKSFGKSIRENLCILADRASELKEYLDQRIAHFSIESSTIECKNLHKIEQRHLLQKVAANKKIVLSRAAMEQILEWVNDRKIRKISIQGKWIFSGKGIVVIENQ